MTDGGSRERDEIIPSRAEDVTGAAMIFLEAGQIVPHRRLADYGAEQEIRPAFRGSICCVKEMFFTPQLFSKNL
jgi:hypothetical protein